MGKLKILGLLLASSLSYNSYCAEKKKTQVIKISQKKKDLIDSYVILFKQKKYEQLRDIFKTSLIKKDRYRIKILPLMFKKDFENQQENGKGRETADRYCKSGIFSLLMEALWNPKPYEFFESKSRLKAQHLTEDILLFGSETVLDRYRINKESIIEGEKAEFGKIKKTSRAKKYKKVTKRKTLGAIKRATGNASGFISKRKVLGPVKGAT